MKPGKFVPLVLASVVSLGLIASCSTAKVSTNQTASEQTLTEASEASTQLAIYVEEDIAIKGADPVAYFEQGAFVQGDNQFSYDWQGATWHFSSAENRDLFISQPEQYAPQYGGFCAWAVSQGATAPIDPTAWKIVDGKLYLNYNDKVQSRWQKDIPGNIAKADQNWPGVLNN